MIRELQTFVDRYRRQAQAIRRALPPEALLARHLHDLEPGLTLTRAALAKTGLPADHPLQVAVVGPTQAGKSSVVNLILGAEAAGVSPLAGHTVHPQGFRHRTDDPSPWLTSYFEGYRQVAPTALSTATYDQYAVVPVAATPDLPPMILWDTPDFDSLRARHYLEGVLRTAALADLLVVVVSKDKYADRAVWDMLGLLAPLGQPVLVCLNKVPAENRDTLVRSWNDKWRRHRGTSPPPLVPLPYWQDDDQREAAAQALRQALRPRLETAAAHRRRLPERVLALARHHWPAWRAPLDAEHEAEAAWRRHVREALAQAEAIYRHDFLDHPVAYETFQRAIAQLLVLLELPGIGRPMTLMRRALTWPLRRLAGGARTSRDTPEELIVLQRGVEHALLQLRQVLSGIDTGDRNLSAHWWRRLAQRYHETLPERTAHFHQAAARYYRQFQPQVEAAAADLYRKLQEMPVTLNGLRAARFSADAGGLALLLQTGGIGPHDFVLAPAVLALTSWLSESALGKYMDRIAARLKHRQLEAVRRLLETQLAARLDDLPAAIPEDERFAIDPDTVATVDDILKRPRYGLHLF